jgi:WD40 repeat protein
VPDFIIGTSDAFVVGIESSLFEEVRREDRRGTLLMQGMAEEVTAVACHPSQPLVAMTCSNGILQVWNYEMKLLMMLREFNSMAKVVEEKKSSTAVIVSGTKGNNKLSSSTSSSSSFLKSKCLAFDSTGRILAIGFSSGIIKLLKTESLEDICSYAPTTEAIQSLKFSSSGIYLAGVDSGNHVLIFKR